MRYLITNTNMSTCFYTIVLMPFGAWKGQRALIFLPWSFFSSKNFNHITKDASVLHLKSRGNHKFSYFLTSNSSRHTSHHHNWSIKSRQFLTYKYGRPTIGGQLWAWKDFHTYFEPTWCHVISPFFLTLLICTFLNLQCVF